MPTIYLDILMILNWLIDYILLHATAFLLHQPYRSFRVVLAAALGGVSSCSVLLDFPPWTVPLYQGAIAVALVWMAFGWNGFGLLLRNACSFFIVSATFAGVALAVWYFAAPDGFVVICGVVYYDLSAFVLISLIVTAYFLMRIFERISKSKIPSEHFYDLKIGKGEKEVGVRALYDTGASPADVFSGRPVIIAERASVEKILPTDFPQEVSDSMQLLGVRLIPVQTLSETRLLPAFFADWICLQERKIRGVYVAVVPTLDNIQCQAIFGRELGEQLR